jgi:hypothetical protein
MGGKVYLGDKAKFAGQQTFCFQEFVDNSQQCFAHNLNFH